MPRQNIIRRLRYLRNWEFANIFILPAILYFIITMRDVQNWQPYAFSAFIVCFILAQGAYYWHLKLQSVTQNQRILPSFFYPLFACFKWANVVLLLAYPALFLINQTTMSDRFQVSIWSTLIFFFAILEHINYYYYQLSHDNMTDLRYLKTHKKIRRSPLWEDMKKSS